MSIDAIAAFQTDQSLVAAAYQRLAVALAEDEAASVSTNPSLAAHGHANVAAAQAALAEAESVANAAQPAQAPVAKPQQGNDSTAAHIVEVVV